MADDYTGTDDYTGADQLNSHLGGVLSGQGQAFVDAANRYGIDPVLLASISMFETGNGTSHMVQTKNNPAGIWDGKAGAYRSFSSLEDGLNFTARNLKNNYIDQGLTTPETIGPKYAPPGASNDPNDTNASWPANVRANMIKIAGNIGGAPPPLAASGSGSPTPTWAQMGGTQPSSVASTGTVFQPNVSATPTTGTDPALAAQIKLMQAALALNQPAAAQQSSPLGLSAGQSPQNYASLNLAPSAGGGGMGNYGLIQAIRLNRARQALAIQNASKFGGQLAQGALQLPGVSGMLNPGTSAGLSGWGQGQVDPFSSGGPLALG